MRWISAVRPPGRSLHVLLLAMALTALAAPAAQAQPFGAWVTFTGQPTLGYINIPASTALNPTGAFTIEAWVAVSNSTTGEDCRSIAGKNYTKAWWIGQCTVGGQPTLRSYLKGGGSAKNGGIIPRGVWTHVAVTFDGSMRRHYINGELAASFAETGPLTTSPGDPMQIGSDIQWMHTPTGAIDEVRVWNVARSISQIRSNLNVRITAPQAGLVGVWALDGSPGDIVGGHGGAVMGSGVGFFTFPVALSCGSSTVNALCLNTRFSITAKWRTNPTPGTPTDGDAHVVVAGPNSGIFWFFSSDNWEVMVKSLNACGLNNRYWVFSAATTNVFYRMEVFDIRAGVNKIYFNYPGPPAPAVTDVDAFATCP
ncbi:MAG TPA: LamG domain-containing protein [Thermoanaerobaculia bacterium]|nr:LamG domain-containing protein [Thermoanaerobaculia bacterium]